MLAYDIGWARLDAFCLVPLSLRSAWRRRVAPNLNQKAENATLKNYSAKYLEWNLAKEKMEGFFTLTQNRPAMPFGNRKKYFRGSFQFSVVTIQKISPLWKPKIW